jgi:hypothetical protein
LDGISGINAGDRSHITSRYRGIAAGLAVPLIVGPLFLTAGQIFLMGPSRGQIVQV